MTRLVVIMAVLFFGWFLPRSVFALDQDEQGPASFYYSQYEHEPWREPGAPKELLEKSGELAAVLLVMSGILCTRKKLERRP